MKRRGIVITLILALLAFVIGGVGVTAGLYATQPSIPGSTATVNFEVKKGDTASDVAQRLEKLGLVRNATFFKLWARYKKLDAGIEPGVYELSPGMTADTIIKKLQTGKPDLVNIALPPGWRVEQYPSRLKALQNFDSAEFLKIAKTGVASDGTDYSKVYWFLPPKGDQVKSALDGYLFPATYDFPRDANTRDVVERLLNTFGQQICPGPDGKPYLYVKSLQDCKANAVKVGKAKDKNILTALEERYFTTDDRDAVHQALTLSSIVMREVSNKDEIQNVTNLYYNRYLVAIGKLSADAGPNSLGADPTAIFARDSAQPPQDPKDYWKPLDGAASETFPDDPYNTNNANHAGLPPGPIGSPDALHLLAAYDPNPDGPTPYFYFISDKCGVEHYAKNLDEHNANTAKYIDNQNYECASK